MLEGGTLAVTLAMATPFTLLINAAVTGEELDEARESGMETNPVSGMDNGCKYG